MIKIRRIASSEVDKLLLEKINKLIPQHTSSRGSIGMEELLQALSDPNYYLFVAEDVVSGEYIGMGSIFFQRNLVRWFAEIHDMAVDEKYRGQGIGKAIVKALINQASEFAKVLKKPIPVYLTSNPKRIAANTLYAKMGFQLIAKAEGEKGTNLYRFIVNPQ